jgi:hypothetical protein
MLDTKLFKLLLALNKNELKSLSDFVASPFFNKNEKVITLYNYIYGFTNDFANPKMTFEKAHEVVFDKKPFKKEDLNKIFSMLTDLVRAFIAYSVYEQNPYIAQHNLLTFYNRRGLETNFETEFEKSIQNLENEQLKNAAFFSNKYKFSQIKYENYSIQKKIDKNVLEAILATLDDNYYYNRLILLCRIKYLCLAKQIENIESMDIEIEKTLINAKNINFITADLWLNAINILIMPTNENYLLVKSALSKYSSIIDLDNKVLIFRILELIIDRLNLSYFQFSYEKNELHKWQFKENLILHNGIITPYTYRNIIAVAMRCNDLKWAKEFSKEYSSKILPSYTEKTDIASICDAMILFEEKKYDDVLDILNILAIADFSIKIDERNIRLKIYYELQYFDIFDDLVNSYRKFLSENKEKLRDYVLVGLRDFVNFTAKIAKTLPSEQKVLAKIKEEIEAINFIPEKIWLLAKIKEKMDWKR